MAPQRVVGQHQHRIKLSEGCVEGCNTANDANQQYVIWMLQDRTLTNILFFSFKVKNQRKVDAQFPGGVCESDVRRAMLMSGRRLFASTRRRWMKTQRMDDHGDSSHRRLLREMVPVASRVRQQQGVPCHDTISTGAASLDSHASGGSRCRIFSVGTTPSSKDHHGLSLISQSILQAARCARRMQNTRMEVLACACTTADGAQQNCCAKSIWRRLIEMEEN